jgi:hypothetical protein
MGRSQPARAAAGDSVVLAWNQQVLDTIVDTKTGPTIAARALAMVHTAIYDARAAYDPVAVGTRLGGNLRRPSADGKPSGKYVDQIDKMTQYSKALDDFRKTTAEYWEDGPGTVTPPGHWNQFAQWVARRDANTVTRTPGCSLPSTTGCWMPASAPGTARAPGTRSGPFSAVRWLQRGKIIQAWGGPYKGPSYIKGENWIPYRPPNDPAPPFAEYASGHSTFSGAAAEVLTGFPGRGNFEMTVTIAAGSSRVEPGAVPAKPITLKWTNFRYAAEQAGLSRQYGGVHFEHGDKDAREAGSKVGKNAWAKALTYFNGTAT